MGQVKSILREFVPNRKVMEIKCSSKILSCSVLQRKNGHIGLFFIQCHTRWFNRKAELLLFCLFVS